MKPPELLRLLKRIRREKRKVFVCGNGGSACNSNHLAEDLMGCSIRAMSLCEVGFLTATANDFDYTHVFTRPLSVWGDRGDLLITISASGTSPNIVKVQDMARLMKLVVFAFPTNRELRKKTPRTEDAHSKLIHDIVTAL